ncbi:MAG: three-Cys-motif partner protein TcmP [Cyclobacteriaceae bacterium]|nr:three-Cys-motif partner protein TcmP [Cyclobacteriaceae bacterium]
MSLTSSPPLGIPDDGFSVTAAEPWIKGKVAIIQQYLTSFAASMTGKANELVFLDLFAGNGVYSLGARKELFAASALMSLATNLPVTKYIFCEKDVEQLRTLKIRVNKYYRGRNVLLLEGKPEDLLSKLDHYIPRSKGSFKVAVFCLCDSFSFDLHFDTVAYLAEQGVNFLIPFSFALNDRLSYKFYLKENREKLRRFLNGAGYLERLENGMDSNYQFYKRLVQIYQNNMLALGYNLSVSTHKADSGLMELPTYQIGFFSKQVSTRVIQQNVAATRHAQFELFQ